MSVAALTASYPDRRIIVRTRGSSHGFVTRLMSPGDLGQILKPFVFLDLVDNQGKTFPTFGLHPHSGIATLTYIAEGGVSYEDTNGAAGILREGGVEWMRAGKGIWHTGGPAEPGRARGFQLWIALPPHLELGDQESIYLSGADTPIAGPARVLLGRHGGVVSRIAAPSSINYLAVRLVPGERWQYQPPADQDVLWVAVGKGAVRAPETISAGELAVFAPGHEGVDFEAEGETEFMLGSAARHPHELITGYYSVHTNKEALEIGERRIDEIRDALVRAGRL